MTPEFKRAQANMAPGVISADGFLGPDSRPLVDIVEADEEKMRSLDLSFDLVYEKMQYLMREGRKGLGDPITVEEKWLVKTDEARGFIPCPFEDGVFRKVTASVTHLTKGVSLIYSELSLHLLKDHHFLQGKGTAFHLEPQILKSILEL
jgi:hypothetical protein